MKFQIKRLLSQILIFFSANLGAVGIKTGFCYPFFYCHACPYADAGCPLGTIEHGLYRGNIVWKFLLFPVLIIGLIGILFGRAFCGWACPIGLLQRATAGTARKLKKYALIKKISQLKIERYLRYTKYFVFIGLVVGTTALIGFMFTDICPVGFLVGTIPMLVSNPGKFVPSTFFYVALVIFVLFIILIFTVERGWCRYFCPLGAMLAPFNKISLLHVSVDQDKCTQCGACTKVCPMGIDVPNMHRDPECIFCGKCIDICPTKAISYKVK